MEVFIKESILIALEKDLEFFDVQMEKNMKDIEKMIKNMEKEFGLKKIERFTKVRL